jgi:hypothetical protein
LPFAWGEVKWIDQKNGVAYMNIKRSLGIALLIAAPLLLGACQQQLFSSSDSYNRQKNERYWGDSAVQQREIRSRSSDMPFGFPTGMANQ